MIIYIRHANDKESNPQYKHDTHINKNCKDDIIQLTHDLIQKYGYPDTIHFSPFMRCKETISVMLNELSYIKT